MTPVTAIEVRQLLLHRFSSELAASGLSPRDLPDDFDLLKAGIVDSLGVIEMISAVERHFQISVDFEPMDPAEITMVGPFSRFVAAHAVGTASAS